MVGIVDIVRREWCVGLERQTYAFAENPSATSSSSATANEATPRAHARARREVSSRELKLRSPERVEETDRIAKHELEAEPAGWVVGRGGAGDGVRAAAARARTGASLRPGRAVSATTMSLC